MNTLQAFDIIDVDDHETEALKELNAFLERPNSIGLDNLKEVLRNTIQLMMELKGYSTGLALHHLVHGEHPSLAVAGGLKGDEEKRRKLQDLEELIRQLNQMMFMEFDRLFIHVQTRIHVIAENIENRIEKLDETIQDAVQDELDETIIENKKKKRSRLKKFLQRIKTREKELKEVDTTEEIIDVETKLSNDVQDLRQGTPEPAPLRSSGPFEVMMESLRSGFKEEKFRPNFYGSATTYRRYDSDKGDQGEGSGDTGSGGDTGKSDETGGGNQEDIEPPRVEL